MVLSALSANANAQLVQSYGQGSSIGDIVLGTNFGRPCNGDEVRNVLGACVLPEISRNIFVYAAPKVIPSPTPRPILPKPEVHYDFVFVKTADQDKQNDPILVPPPQQKTLVYVLSKKQEQDGESIIQAPFTPAARPEVFYVNYGEGDNPQLPGGVDLETALSSGATQGQNLNFQNPNFGTNQNEGNNISGDIRNSQNQGNNIASDIRTSQNQGNNIVGDIKTSQNQGSNIISDIRTTQIQGNNIVGVITTNQIQANNIVSDIRTSQNQGNDFIGDIIEDDTISNGFVSPDISSPPNVGGFINGGGFSGGLQLVQGSVDGGVQQAGFRQQDDFNQQPSGSFVFLQNPTISQGAIGVQDPSARLIAPLDCKFLSSCK